MRILVTGSRDWDYWPLISCGLTWAWQQFGVGSDLPTVVHGGARGADSLADSEAGLRGWPVEVHEADWRAYGRAAGMIRNRLMVSLGADVCLAFILNGSRGATHCANEAERAGIRVRRYTLNDL